KDEKWDAETHWYIFPLKPNLPNTWTGFSQSDLESLFLNPGESLDLGFYLNQDAVNLLALHPSSKPSLEKYSMDAKASCPAVSIPPLPAQDNWDGGAWYCKNMNTPIGGQGYGFSDEAVQICRQAIPAMRACVSSGGAKEPCNQAALLDEQLDQRRRPHPNNGLPWPIWLSCKNSIPTPEGRVGGFSLAWNWLPILAEFKQGLELEPVTVDFSSRDIAMFARFAPSRDTANSESREIPLIQNGLKLQD
ncbi:MAG: hypothetical protein AABZ55_10945, partial [Bdellovibrionota bacterium]